jgi:hypothetical protein
MSDHRKARPGFSNPRCYARALKGCCIAIDREHPISKTLLEAVAGDDNAIMASNLAWQQDPITPQRISVKSMTAKTLCHIHNESLSEYDAEGSRMYLAILAMQEAGANAAGVTWTIDGDKFERLVLKLGMGQLYSGGMQSPTAGPMKGICPPQEWLEILYRGAEFPRKQGLYWVPTRLLGPAKTTGQFVITSVVTTNGDLPIGAFTINMLNMSFCVVAADLSDDDPVLPHCSYRPTALVVRGLKTRIELKWKHGPQTGEIVVGRRKGG